MSSLIPLAQLHDSSYVSKGGGGKPTWPGNLQWEGKQTSVIWGKGVTAGLMLQAPSFAASGWVMAISRCLQSRVCPIGEKTLGGEGLLSGTRNWRASEQTFVATSTISLFFFGLFFCLNLSREDPMSGAGSQLLFPSSNQLKEKCHQRQTSKQEARVSKQENSPNTTITCR